MVGGGISGLSTCYFVNELAALTRQMIHLTLIEAGNRLGGKIVTDFDGMIIEGGPDSLFTLKTYALDLSKELGLSNDQVVADSESKGTYILNRGKLSKLPEGTESGMPGKLLPFLQTDLVSFSGKVRVLMDLVVPKRQETSDESIGSFIGRRIGRQFLEKIVEPLYAGIFAGDVYQLSAKAVLPRLVETESTHGSLIRGATGTKTIPPNSDKATRSQLPTFVTMKGGLIQLVDGIVSRLNGTSIMLTTEVLGVSTSYAREGTHLKSW